jgi:hypothetical protein
MPHPNKALNSDLAPDSKNRHLLQILSQAVELREGDNRLDDLIADFEAGDGFAKGWRMAVGRCFHDSLDIKSTKQGCEANGDADGVLQKRKRISRWTQGSAFSFSMGDTIYDSREAYLRWDLAIKRICLAFQVIAASPARPKKEVAYIKKNTSFAGMLRGNAIRRAEVLELISENWLEEREIVEDVNRHLEKSTNKGVTTNLLRSLCDAGALDRKVEVADERFPGSVRYRVLKPNTEKTSLCIEEEKATTQDAFVALLIAGSDV